MIFYSPDPDPVYPEVDIYHYLDSNPCNVQPGKTLFIDPVQNRSITFGQFQIETKQFAAGLQDTYGFKTKDVLAIFSYNQVRNKKDVHFFYWWHDQAHHPLFSLFVISTTIPRRSTVPIN